MTLVAFHMDLTALTREYRLIAILIVTLFDVDSPHQQMFASACPDSFPLPDGRSHRKSHEVDLYKDADVVVCERDLSFLRQARSEAHADVKPDPGLDHDDQETPTVAPAAVSLAPPS